MNLARFPRRRYTPGPTPLEPMPRLTRIMGGPDLYIKRDDLLGLAGGGNKTRKLEFLVADALAAGADTLLTVGAVQSNHCRLTAAAAARDGLKCRLILEERVANSFNPNAVGNVLFFKLLGVEKITIVPAGTDMPTALQQAAAELTAEGRKGYVIPVGGSNPIGSVGYAACAEEILAQAFDLGIAFDSIVTTSGSTGTHAGLLAGLHGNNADIPVVGINISRAKDLQEPMVHDLAQRTARHLGLTVPVPRSAVQCFDEYVGPGYSLPTPEMVEAVKLVGAAEGILLDPVYTGKAMAGLLDLIRKGVFRKGQRILFLHTGGAPALHVYADSF